MTSSWHQLILASAGTGKTFRLTNQFLRLLFRGVAPDRILATTFTRKAAGEILDRVLVRLVEGADDAAKCAELSQALELPALRPSDCLSLLARLTKHIDSFQVRTIDAFFLGLVQLFALDLGLPPNWSIAGSRLDSRLRSDALQDALGDSSSAELLELLRELNQGSITRSVHRFMLDRTAKLRPIYLESNANAWDRLVPTADVTDEVFEEALTAFATTHLPLTKAGSTHKSFQKAWLKLESLARHENWAGIFESGLGAKVMEGSQVFSKAEISAECLAVIEPILQRAVHCWLAQLVNRNLATYDLLDRFEKAYELRKLSLGAFQFDDLPLALAPRNAQRSPLDERELDLWFRMDGQVDHLLLDEFQDTSPIQWRILEHLASEIASDGTGERSFFCVGDVKQSIYGFRQAEPRLLANMHNLLPGLKPERMDVSYRSSQIVLDLVNCVFTDIGNNAAFGAPELMAYREAASAWQTGFEAHGVNCEKPGAACVFEARPKESGDAEFEAMLELVVERVLALTAEAPLAEIGILMRVRKHIPALILRLKREGLSASGEGGNELVDSQAVLVYISLLQLADHPDDSAAAFHVASSPFGGYLGLSEAADPETRRQFARDFRSRLVHEGLGSVTSDLAVQVAADLTWTDWDQARFAQLLGQAFSFESEMKLRASDFVDQLRKERIETPGGARVRVMTVHASKGLEFECVLLPDLDNAFAGIRDGTLTYRPQPDGLIEFVSLSPNKKHLKVSSELEELYQRTTERMVADGLSNLYVAMTRAVRRLELLITNRADRGNGVVPSMADFILAALPAEQVGDADTEGPIWSHHGNSADWAASESVETEALSTESAPCPLALAPSLKLRHLPRRSPSHQEGAGRIDTHQLLAAHLGSKRGNLVHTWLEHLEWIEDFAIDRETMLMRGRSIEPQLALREAALDDLSKALACDEIRAALSKDCMGASEADRISVQNELRFALILPDDEGPEGEGQDSTTDPLWTGAIDRLVLGYRGDEVVAATIIDYKTDRVDEADLASRVDYYRPQLEGYTRVVAAQTGLRSDAIKKQLLFLGLGRCVELD